MEQYPKRKTNRLSSDLYGKNGSYFITICSKDRANLFWRFPVGAALRRPPEILNDRGLAVLQQIEKIDDIYDGIITVKKSTTSTTASSPWTMPSSCRTMFICC